MKKILNKVIKTRTVSQDDLGDLLTYVNKPENSDKYYLTSEAKEDRIGKYHVLITNPMDPENQYKTKIYEKENDNDLVAYRVRYYDILRDESTSYTKKAMQLYALQKNIEYAFSKERKIHETTGEFKELEDLLEKVKKARSYYGLKVFLKDNSSTKEKKKLKDS